MWAAQFVVICYHSNRKWTHPPSNCVLGDKALDWTTGGCGEGRKSLKNGAWLWSGPVSKRERGQTECWVEKTWKVVRRYSSYWLCATNDPQTLLLKTTTIFLESAIWTVLALWFFCWAQWGFLIHVWSAASQQGNCLWGSTGAKMTGHVFSPDLFPTLLTRVSREARDTFQISACVIFGIAPLAKTSHIFGPVY